MALQKLLPLVTSVAARPGRHKVPRFIYHMTNKSAYESMLKDGFIKPGGEGDLLKGVFTTDIVNFFKRWRKDKSWLNESLQERLVSQAAKGNDELIMLRIPTDKLNANELVIRSQNRILGHINSITLEQKAEVEEFVQKQAQLGVPMDEISKLLLRKFFPQAGNHVEKGTLAKFSKLFKQRKEAIEFVYPHEIKISDVEKIGEVNIAKLRASADYDVVRPMRSIFTQLLKGTPECKGASLLNC